MDDRTTSGQNIVVSAPQSEDRLTFGKGLDRVVVYLIAGLTAWLCVSTMALREQMAAMLERDAATKRIIENVQANVDRHDTLINQIRIEAAMSRRVKGE